MAGAAGSWRGRRGKAYAKGVALGPLPSCESPLPHLSEPGESVILKRPPPRVVPGRLAERLPAGDSSPAPDGDGASPGEHLRDLWEPNRLPGEKDGLTDLPLVKTPACCLSVSIHPLAWPHTRVPLPLEI